MSDDVKVRDNRVRRMAKRQGLELIKSRRRDTRALDYGGYLLVDPATSMVVYSYGWNDFGASLDDIEAWLTQPR
jgi:hypothetical protein